MSKSHNVYMANASSQDIYVVASLNQDWAIADFFTDISLLLVGVGEIKSVVMAAELPERLNTLRDLYNFLKIAGKLLVGTSAVGSRSAEAALALLDAFKKTSIQIASGDYKNVNENGFGMYLSADGIASMLGASNVSLLVLSGDGKQLAMWNTNSDDSWIATNEQKIVRSKYGLIWQQDPGADTQDWPISSA